jgi:hypothetical protein
MVVNPIRSFFGVSTLKKAGRAGKEVNSKNEKQEVRGWKLLTSNFSVVFCCKPTIMG